MSTQSASPAPTGTASVLGASAADEWSALVATAVLGTDRRLPPPPLPGWEAWGRAADPAVAVLDGRILAGEHELLLPEWLLAVEALGVQLPWASLPTLLLRARRNPRMDQVVRRLAGGRAAWLAQAVPELGVSVQGLVPKADAPPFGPPPRVTDSGAVVASIVTLFADGQATWATAAQLRILVAAVDPAWLPSLVVELTRLPFHAPSERTRAELVGLAEFRLEMHRELAGPSTLLPTPPPSTGEPA